jgi:indole-3-glycerol phosphate synthase
MAEGFLDKIIPVKKQEIANAKTILPQDKIIDMLRALAPDGDLKNHFVSKRDFASAISSPGKINLIAEIKKASPSKGILREDFDPLAIARQYYSAGASAISILTDEHFFSGHNSFVGKVKDAVKLPVLRKDFIIDEYQVYQSALIEADCILLIAEILDKKKIESLLLTAAMLNVEVLVEANTEAGLDNAIASGAKLIGINNRDLNTFEVDIKITQRLIKKVPKDKIIVSESGIKTADDVKYLKSLGVNAVLIGEAFMLASDIPAKVKEIIG